MISFIRIGWSLRCHSLILMTSAARIIQCLNGETYYLDKIWKWKYLLGSQNSMIVCSGVWLALVVDCPANDGPTPLSMLPWCECWVPEIWVFDITAAVNLVQPADGVPAARGLTPIPVLVWSINWGCCIRCCFDCCCCCCCCGWGCDCCCCFTSITCPGDPSAAPGLLEVFRRRHSRPWTNWPEELLMVLLPLSCVFARAGLDVTLKPIKEELADKPQFALTKGPWDALVGDWFAAPLKFASPGTPMESCPADIETGWLQELKFFEDPKYYC